MIKLFRNIRQSLLAEGKTTKYLKYAAGEILLVVIGILIALQINNWNEDRKLKKETYQVLLQMQDDFSRNQNELKLKIEQHKFVKESVDELSSLVSPNPIKIEQSKLDSLMFSMIYIPEFNVSTSIASSEKLGLVDDQLKAYIGEWKLNYDYYKFSINLISESLNQLTPFLIENYQYKNFKNELIPSTISAFDTNGKKTLSSPIFENFVNMKSLNSGFVYKRAISVYDLQDKILKHIKTKLSSYD